MGVIKTKVLNIWLKPHTISNNKTFKLQCESFGRKPSDEKIRSPMESTPSTIKRSQVIRKSIPYSLLNLPNSKTNRNKFSPEKANTLNQSMNSESNTFSLYQNLQERLQKSKEKQDELRVQKYYLHYQF